MAPLAVLVGVGLALASAGPGPAQFGRTFVSVNQVPPTLRTGDGRTITVLDARDAKDFRRGHLSGAVHVDWTDYRRGMFREGRLPKDLQALAKDLGRLGVDGSRPVLVCGAARDGWGEEGRIAWMLLVLGHPDVAILDGGCKTWSRAGRLMVRGDRRPIAGNFKPKINKALRAELRDVKAALKAASAGPSTAAAAKAPAKVEGIPQLVDVRRLEEFQGATPYFSSRGGRVPGARHLYWKALLDPTTGRVISPEAVRAAVTAAGLDVNRPLITYCTGGVRSAHAALVMRAAGLDARNYDGSWWEYASEDELPVER